MNEPLAQPLRSVMVTAPSRLHFGLFSFGHSDSQYGGAGVMVESPAVRVGVRIGDHFTVEGMHAHRARRIVELVLQNLQFQGHRDRVAILRERLNLQVRQAPREHIGLGVGTQLSLAIAAAISSAIGLDRTSAVELAKLAGRGARSAIGTHGFDHGGLLVDGGKTDEIQIAPLIARVEMPPEWRFVLLCPKLATGLSGAAERTAFETLAPVPREISNQLRRQALDDLIPAAVANQFDRFSRGLYRFNRLAGDCFAVVQGGAFASDETARLIEKLRTTGIEGVGQSSWGPTVFGLCISEVSALGLVERWRSSAETPEYEMVVSAPANQGARIELVAEA